MEESSTLVRSTIVYRFLLTVGLFAATFAWGAPAEKPELPDLDLGKESSGEEAIQRLGAQLPQVAAHYRKDAERFSALLRRDESLRLDRHGRLFYRCDWLPGSADPAFDTDDMPFTAATAPLDQTFRLHSKPGSTRTIYLDFDGHVISGTAWNKQNNGGADIVAPAWSLDSDPATFNTAELTAIQQIWLRVSEDYAGYDVDVTTEFPGEAALTRGSPSDPIYGVRALVSPIGSYFRNPGGISYVGVFDTVGDTYKPSLVFPENLGHKEKNIAEALSHEVGHALGLSHDGQASGTEYYSGQGNWAPIMGVGYSRPITQWSKGEYANASNTEDDLAVITQNGLNYRADDAGDTAATAAPLGAGTIRAGTIARTGDKDFYSFQTGDGTAQITVAPFERGANLHVSLSLYDRSGTLVTNREAVDTTAGAQPVSLSTWLRGGTYYLCVEGKGSGDPATAGYSSYGSLGQYTVNLSTTATLTAQPVRLALAKTSGGVAVQFPSQPGTSYVLQASPDLKPAAWQNVRTNAGTGGTISIPVATNAAPQQFWRVLAY